MTTTRTEAPRRRLGRLALVSGAALALFAALPMSSASAAASGTFYYESATAGSQQIVDPPLHQCLTLFHATGASNQTNATARVYYDGNCQNEWGSLQSGGYSNNFGAKLYSVQFGS
ncbi:hypothetical protein C9F11_25345 [Streptomyces sp. YIM 121038]|uniref:hypothetical protein n=1 Tax=Streptomyces sp. YIM 121038 TaxID=2136401 RepID=UPI0011101A1D|nr:hypothetical protein [Streptomyces sp. YIM 121038]QCX78681.1 hypothetical protein C9F11_25345 [Streptomyces sp. YIM 121038]